MLGSHCAFATSARTPLQLLSARRSIAVLHVPCAARQEAPSVYDVVEYLECLPKRPGEPSAAAEQQRRVRLGVVAGVQQRQQAVTVEVEPLVMEEEGVWRHDEEVWDEPQKVAVDLVLRVVDADYSQRQDKIGPGNPHGEHAHDVFLPLVPLAPDIFKGKRD